MEELLERIRKEWAEFNQNAAERAAGNKTAGVRSRKNSLAIEEMFKAWRKESVKSGE